MSPTVSSKLNVVLRDISNYFFASYSALHRCQWNHPPVAFSSRTFPLFPVPIKYSQIINPAFLIERSALLSDGLALSAGSAKTWKQCKCVAMSHVYHSQQKHLRRFFFPHFLLGAQQFNLSAKSLVSSCPLSFFRGLIIFGSRCMFVVVG